MEEKSMAKEMLVRKIRNYIETNQAEELSLNKIASELNYSKFYMERVFTETTGMTICKYIQTCRLNAAAEQLVQTNRPIIDIALEAGYNSPQAFTQAFRRMYLCPPRVYRKNGAGQQAKTMCIRMFREKTYANGSKARGKNIYMGTCRTAFIFEEGRWAA